MNFITLFQKSFFKKKVNAIYTEKQNDLLLFEKLESLMKSRKPYLKHSLKRRELANELCTNETYLSIAIRKGANMTVNEYINSYRIQYAQEILKTSGNQFTIEMIASKSGFNTARHFYRIFHKEHNLTPEEYRKTHRQITKHHIAFTN